MTIVPFNFNPNASPPFQATVKLDGNQYNLTTTWNLYRGDWYFTITDQSGTVVITAALVGSSVAAPIYLVPGIFSSSTIFYDQSTGNFVVTP